MKKNILIILIVSILIIFFIEKDNKENDNSNIVNNVEISNNSEIINNLEIKNNVETQNIILNENSITINQIEQEDTLKNKTIAFLGDSLIEGYGNDFKGVDYYLKEYLPNTNFINNSKSGSTITDNSGNDNIIMINQVRTLIGNPDIIMFDGGANDIIGYTLGFLNNDLKKEIGSVDINSNTITTNETVISDLEEIIIELKNRFPNAKLCYIQPFLLDDETISKLTQDENKANEIKVRRNQFYEQLLILCNKWNIDYLDISYNFIGTENIYRQSDWIHINEKGYKLLTPYILQKLKEM